MSSKTKTILIRFTKGFVFSGLSTVSTFLVASNYQIPTGETAILTLIIAFITGGLLGWEKYMSWTDTPPGIIPSERGE